MAGEAEAREGGGGGAGSSVLDLLEAAGLVRRGRGGLEATDKLLSMLMDFEPVYTALLAGQLRRHGRGVLMKLADCRAYVSLALIHSVPRMAGVRIVDREAAAGEAIAAAGELCRDFMVKAVAHLSIYGALAKLGFQCRPGPWGAGGGTG